MTNFYLITKFVALLVGGDVANNATSGTKHLPDQGAIGSSEVSLDSRRSRGLGHDVRVVDVHRVQSHLRVELARPTKQVAGAPLWGRRSRLQDPEVGTIQSFALLICFSY
jgi:hypothetical protein